jgi:hypothetical protein
MPQIIVTADDLIEETRPRLAMPRCTWLTFRGSY